MNHIMLDLETLGSNPRAPIASIGAVLFDPEEGIVEETFYRVIDIKSYDEYKDYFALDYSTVSWWMAQSSDAIRSTFVDGEKIPLGTALDDFASFVPSRLSTLMWGNGADFDNVILAHAYDMLSINKPWSFRNNRCFRTVKNMVGTLVPFVREGTHHNSLDDATSQAKFLMEALKIIRIGETSGSV